MGAKRFNRGTRPHGLSVGGRQHSVTVTFWYGNEPHTVVARNREDALDEARRRWGDDWTGEPVFSSPTTILNDITGVTKARHGTKYALAGRHLQPRDVRHAR